MRAADVIERAVAEMLQAALPPRLEGKIGPQDIKEWTLEHLEVRDDEMMRFPGETFLPWTNMIGDDGDWYTAFFTLIVVERDALGLICGVGSWPEVRNTGDKETDDLTLTDLYRIWSARFIVPCPPLVFSKPVAKEWLGRDW